MTYGAVQRAFRDAARRALRRQLASDSLAARRRNAMETTCRAQHAPSHETAHIESRQGASRVNT
ncbi:hypothetical protein UA18_05436 [Burkholderia multivorans]|uniref:Uncharacterized protein n=1 Tax=Burkholderia multivorans TaxID=87883 RepID=A0ABD7LC79_9BURK|nr:hypothetical protein UA17_05084 [Burkholderia multivorans]SAK02172.1 hypothetical protein UA18_05436 [Burkholderia multivorans]